jgi:mannose-1-phosphate guanylyltransferase
MQAIVLVGGEGTRLRPLTSTVPKPALTLVDRPFLAYMVEWLGRHGVEEVFLACGFLPDVLREALGEGERSGTRIRYVVEPEPLGTAGAIRFAADELGDELGERFLALNGDVLTDLDPGALLAAPARPSACTRSRTPPPTAWSAATRTAPCSSSSRRPASRRRGRSMPACTRSSARSST